MKKGHRRRADVVLLKDLAPDRDVKGGAGKGKRVFGERIETTRPGTAAAEKKAKSPDTKK